MEQEVRDLLEGYVVERRAVLDQIEARWAQQARRPTAAEVDTWMAIGRPMKAVVDTNVVAYLLLGTQAFVDEARNCFEAVYRTRRPAHIGKPN